MECVSGGQSFTEAAWRRQVGGARGKRPRLSAPGSLPSRTLSFRVPPEESSPGIPPGWRTASTSLGAQQAPLRERPAAGACVRGHTEESCCPWWGQEQTVEGRCTRSSFVNHLLSARLSFVHRQLRFLRPPHREGHTQFPTFVNREPKSPKEVGAPIQ